MCCVFLQKGDTPLHYASSNDEAAAIEALLKNGAAINQINNVGQITDLLFHVHT